MIPQLTPEAIKLLNYWKGIGARLNPGASEEALAALTQKVGCRLPPALLVFYSWANGMEDWTSDGSMFSLWPLERILRELSARGIAEPFSQGSTLPFADYLICSYLYELVLEGPQAGSVVVNWGTGVPEIVGADLFDFFARLWSEPATVHVYLPR
jgi:hypothetical protein